MEVFVFLKMLVVRKVNSCQCLCSQRNTPCLPCSHARKKKHLIPLTSTVNQLLYPCTSFEILNRSIFLVVVLNVLVEISFQTVGLRSKRKPSPL